MGVRGGNPSLASTVPAEMYGHLYHFHESDRRIEKKLDKIDRMEFLTQARSQKIVSQFYFCRVCVCLSSVLFYFGSLI